MVLCIIYTYSYPIPHCTCQVKQFVLLVSCIHDEHCIVGFLYSLSTWLVLCTANLPTRLVLCTASLPGQCYVQLVYLPSVMYRQSTCRQCYVQKVYLYSVMYSQTTWLLLCTASLPGQCYIQLVDLAVNVQRTNLPGCVIPLVLCTARFMYIQSTQ